MYVALASSSLTAITVVVISLGKCAYQVDELGGQLDGRGQPVDHLHRVQRHLHVHKHRKVLGYLECTNGDSSINSVFRIKKNLQIVLVGKSKLI